MRRTIIARFVEFVPSSVTATAAARSAVAGAPTSRHEATANFRKLELAAEQSDIDKESKGFFFLPKLKYPTHCGVPPVFSAEQFEYLYNVVHKDHIATLNRFAMGTDVEGHGLEAVIRATSFDATKNAIHTAACEHFSHCFFYNSLRPWGTQMPASFREVIQLQYGSATPAEQAIKTRFVKAASTLQSRTGWVFLVWTGTKLDVVAFEFGTCPIAQDLIPLLCLPVNESCYGIDYDSTDRDGLWKYVDNYFKGCNWGVAAQYYSEAAERRSEPKL